MTKSSAAAAAVAVSTSGTLGNGETARTDCSWRGNPDLDSSAREAMYANRTPSKPPSRGYILEQIMARGGPRGKTVSGASVSYADRPTMHVRGVTEGRRAKKQGSATRFQGDQAVDQPVHLRRGRVGTTDVRRAPALRRAR